MALMADENTLDAKKLEELFEEFRKFRDSERQQTPAQFRYPPSLPACPCCGRCPMCGRGDWQPFKVTCGVGQ